MNEIPPLRRIETFVFRAPIEEPVVTSFGVMHDRPAVLVRVEDEHKASGWGESWCNFPTCGAEHRARLIDTVLAPLLLGRAFASPADALSHLELGTRILALQTGEPGPLAQAMAGIDIALWDLAARRAGKPLYALLGGGRVDAVPAYASGINQKNAITTIEQSRAAGFCAFKVKLGSDRDADVRTIRQTHEVLRPGERLMADANQGWSIDSALAIAGTLQDYPLDWLEEPLPADAPIEDWKALATRCPVPLAGGENLAGTKAFEQAIGQGLLQVIQPDLCKWGGFSRCYPVARQARAAGRRYCPHYLGGGIGLLASAHLLAAVGGDGRLEVDANPNPLRQQLAQPFPALRDGVFALPQSPGLGVTPDLDATAEWVVMHATRTV